jgi:hypothetical protein
VFVSKRQTTSGTVSMCVTRWPRDVPAHAPTNVITTIPDDAGTLIECTEGGQAEVAECDYTTGKAKRAASASSSCDGHVSWTGSS